MMPINDTVLKKLHGWWVGSMVAAVASSILHFVVFPSSILWLILTTPKHLSPVNIITVNIHIKKMANNWMGGDGSILDGNGQWLEPGVSGGGYPWDLIFGFIAMADTVLC
jgi:hypothetical protein